MQKNPDDQEIDTESTERRPKNREKPLRFHGAINSKQKMEKRRENKNQEKTNWERATTLGWREQFGGKTRR